MAPSGGSTTIYGILYQMLGALDSVLRYHLLVNDVSIILEPSNGGDAQIHSRTVVIVEQWKSMDGGGTWSFNDFAGKVAHDLYRAVPSRDDPARHTKDFRFVLRTEARIGAWKPVYDFFRTELASEPPQDVAAALRVLDENKYATGSRPRVPRLRPEGKPIPASGEQVQVATKDQPCPSNATPTELFRTLMNGVKAGHTPATKEFDEVVLEKIWFMMSRFEFPTEPDSFDALEHRIKQLLLNFVVDRDQVDVRANALISALQVRATEGNARINPRQFLEDAGINVDALSDWLKHKERASALLSERCVQLYGYTPNQDVRHRRDHSTWPAILVLAGESGQGKSWALASMAHRLGPEEGIPLLIKATGDFHADRDTIERELWHQIFSKDSRKDLRQVREHLKQVLRGSSPVRGRSKGVSVDHELPDPWLVVFIDDVPTKGEVEAICAEGWGARGIRVVVSTQPAHTGGLLPGSGGLVELRHVEDFTKDELSSYLHLHERSAQSMPEGLSKVLCRPLLARLFCSAGPAATNHEASEYTVLNAYWLTLDPPLVRPLRALAGEFLTPGVVYPWGDAALDRAGITPELFGMMVSSGWLRHRGNGHLEVWHDRILAWAVAEHIAERWGSGALDTEAVVKFVGSIQLWRWRGGRDLGYVTMDLIWMVASRPRLRPRFVELLLALEPHARREPISWVFEKGIATIGMESIHDLLLDCLRQLKTPEQSWLPELLSGAWTSSGERLPELRWLLYASEMGLWMLGLHLYVHRPQRELLGRVWQLRSQHPKLHHCMAGTVLWAALQAGCDKFPDWLVEKVTRTRSPSVAETAALLINDADDATGADLWSGCREVLLECASAESFWGLGRLIARSGGSDQDLVTVRGWIAEDVGVDALGHALFPLVVHKPDEVLTLLRENEWVPRACSRHPERLAELAARSPVGLQEVLVDLLANGRLTPSAAACAFMDCPDSLTTGMIDALINTVGSAFDDVDPDTVPPPDFRPPASVEDVLRLLARVVEPDQITLVRSGLSDRRLDEKLAQWIGADASWGRYPHRPWVEVEHILGRYTGVGLTRRVNRLLDRASSADARFRGASLAHLSPDDDTRAAIHDLAWDPPSTNTDMDDLADAAQLRSFALLDDGRGLIELVLHRGSPSILNFLSEWLCEGHTHMAWSAELRQVVRGQLRSHDPSVVAHGLCAAALDASTELIGDVRSALRLREDEPEVLASGLLALGWHVLFDDEILDWGRLGLGEPAAKMAAQHLLLSAGGQDEGSLEALEALTESFQGMGSVSLDDDVFPLVVEAWSRCPPESPLRTSLANLLWSAIERSPGRIGDWSQIDELATEAGVSAVETVGRKLVQYQPSNVRFISARVTAGAFRALYRTDPGAVWIACKQRFVNAEPDPDRDTLASLMLDLFPAQEAIGFLVTQAVDKEIRLKPSSGLPVIWRIGGALRKRSVSPDVPEGFEEVLRDSLTSRVADARDSRTLYALTILIGTQKPGFLHEVLSGLADHDHPTVRRGARAALQLQRRQGWIDELMTRIKEASIEDSWLPLNALMDIITPHTWATRTHLFDYLRDLELTIICRRQRWHVESLWKNQFNAFEKQLKDTKLEF